MDGTKDETLKLVYSQGLSAGVFRRIGVDDWRPWATTWYQEGRAL